MFVEIGQRLLARILEEHPDCGARLATSEGVPCVLIPSAHPTIRTPLTVRLEPYLPVHWHGGYFFDFIGEDPVEEAVTFLGEFFREEFRCGVRWHEGSVAGGGPVVSEKVSWIGPYDRIEVRSWRGNGDEDYVAST